jgi:hypothetical protein
MPVECTRERMPLDWACSQHGLANTLVQQMRDPVRMA